MRLRRLLPVLLCLGALASGSTALLERWRLTEQWRGAPPAGRAEMLLGEFRTVIEKVERTVHPEGSILLFSGLDPALLPYYLHPRRIWQVRSDPETNALYMDLPPSGFPERSAESFDADWRLYYFPDNIDRGGDLVYAGRRGRDR